MHNDDQNLSDIASLLQALEVAVNNNEDNKDIDLFVGNVLRYLSENDQSNEYLRNKNSDQIISSILATSRLSVELLIKFCKFSDAQFKLLVKLKVLIVRDGYVYLGILKSIPPAMAKTLISFFALITMVIVAAIVIYPFPGFWFCSIAFTIGDLIGIGIGMTLDRSFKLYKLIEKLKRVIDWLPKDSKIRPAIV